MLVCSMLLWHVFDASVNKCLKQHSTDMDLCLTANTRLLMNARKNLRGLLDGYVVGHPQRPTALCVKLCVCVCV